MIYRTPSPKLTKIDTEPYAGNKDVASRHDLSWDVTLLESSVAQLSLPTELRANRQQFIENEPPTNIINNSNCNYGTGKQTRLSRPSKWPQLKILQGPTQFAGSWVWMNLPSRAKLQWEQSIVPQRVHQCLLGLKYRILR